MNWSPEVSFAGVEEYFQLEIMVKSGPAKGLPFHRDAYDCAWSS